MSVLVTGAAGFIGSHLTERLLREGEEVVGLDNFNDFYDPGIKERNLAVARSHVGFTEIRGDIRDSGVLDSMGDDIDSVVHLAARAGVRPSISDPVGYADVNVVGTVSLLKFARRRQIKPFVFASSSSVYGNNSKIPFSEDDPVTQPVSPYAATKRAGELLCHTATHLDDTACVCLRLFTAYGPRQRPDLAIHRFTSLLADGESIPVFGDGSTVRDYTYIDDLIEGIIGALGWAREHPATFEIVNLGESRMVSLSDMISVVANSLGVEPVIDRRPLVPGDVLRTHADVSKAGRLFGYEPRTDFVDGVGRFVEWYMETAAPGSV